MKNIVTDVSSIEEFVDRYYKKDRLNAEKGRRERLIESRKRDVARCGDCLISRHDSVTGEAVWFVGGGE